MPERVRLSRDDVVAKAAELADRDGLEALTLTAVAEALDVQPSALYNHVDGADGLLASVSVQATAELLDLIRSAAIGRAGREALEEIALVYRNYAEDHPGRYGATLLPTSIGDDERRDLDAETTELFARIVESFGVDDDGLHAARAIRSALHGFVSLEATEGFPLRHDLDDSFDRLTALLATGLEAG